MTLSDGSRISTRTLVWTAGVRPSPPSASSGSRSTSAGGSGSTRSCAWRAGRTCGRSATAAACRTRRRPTTPIHRRASMRCGRPRRLARNLTGTPKPYRFRTLGQVATLGRYKGIAELPGHIRLRGFIAWWVTRSYHLYQVPLWSAKAAGRDRLDGRTLLPARHRRVSLLQEPRPARRMKRRRVPPALRIDQRAEEIVPAPSGERSSRRACRACITRTTLPVDLGEDGVGDRAGRGARADRLGEAGLATARSGRRRARRTARAEFRGLGWKVEELLVMPPPRRDAASSTRPAWRRVGWEELEPVWAEGSARARRSRTRMRSGSSSAAQHRRRIAVDVRYFAARADGRSAATASCSRVRRTGQIESVMT